MRTTRQLESAPHMLLRLPGGFWRSTLARPALQARPSLSVGLPCFHISLLIDSSVIKLGGWHLMPFVFTSWMLRFSCFHLLKAELLLTSHQLCEMQKT